MCIHEGGGFITLEQFFKENPSVALGFSGGVDSSYLLYAGVKHGAEVRAYYLNAEFQPDFELEDARKVAEQVGAELTVLERAVLGNRTVAANPPDRCYHCKQLIFGELRKQADADGVPVLIDGTNASDDAGDRPGMRALSEMGVRSPLRECGISKSEVRRLAREAGLHTWDKPSYACLATRVPQGREITPDLLRRIEKSEDALFALGFADFRVRVYGDAARLQLPQEQMARALGERAHIIRALKPYFGIILLDFEGR